MQTANVMVALGGDRGTTVFRPDVTASEIAVLQAIHGADAVFDIEPVGEIERSDREEMTRLFDPLNGYGRARGGDGNVEIVKAIFPNGTRSSALRTIDELQLDESLFKPLTRANAPAAKPEKKSKKAEKPVEPAPEGDGGLFDE